MLDLTNFKEHPVEKSFMVFHFSDPQRAEFFESELNSGKLFFEKHLDEEDKRIYFAVRRADFRMVSAINDDSRIRFRKPFIPDKSLRYFVLSLFFIMVVLALGGIISEQLKN
jgi:hypothetical protein